MASGPRNRIVNGLISKLHGALSEFITNIDKIVEENQDIRMDDIRRLRDLIHRRLTSSEDVADRKRLIDLLGLFATDKAVIELVRDDAEEWIRLLDAIRSHIEENSDKLTDEERREAEEINRLTAEIKMVIRK